VLHQDWLVVRGAGESVEDEDDEDEAESSEDDASGVLVADGVALDDDVVLATVVAPIEPSNRITPQAMTNALSVAATTVRRIRATRRARSARRARPRAARSGGGIDMRPS
jgi:hypothetical protein